jgi:hypothetical protein
MDQNTGTGTYFFGYGTFSSAVEWIPVPVPVNFDFG